MVRPKVVRSVHYCPSTAKTLERRFTDLASLDPYPSQPVYPTTDDEGTLSLEYVIVFRNVLLIGLRSIFCVWDVGIVNFWDRLTRISFPCSHKSFEHFLIELWLSFD